MKLAFVLGVSTSLVLFALPHPAFGEVTVQDRARSLALFNSANKELARGNFAAACPIFEEVQRLSPGVGTLLNLGTCYAGLGRTASAWTAFNQAANLAWKANDSAKVQLAKASASNMEARLAFVTIVRPDEPSAEVVVDGTPWRDASLGSKIPIDPGPHTIEVSAPGRKRWATTIELKEGGSVEVLVPPLESMAVEPAGEPVAPPSQLVTAPQLKATPPAPAAPPGASASSSWSRPTAVALGSVGLTTVLIGGFFGLRAREAWSSAKPYCADDGCRQPGYGDWQSAKNNARASTVLFTAGAALMAGGVVLWIALPGRTSAALQLSPGRAAVVRTF